ncbi:MAG: tetratricopeptide repeat protein [Nannocystaceae bacterium]|nr:tetratricopeptide repeat protein [Nannocystaceae bacterium]
MTKILTCIGVAAALAAPPAQAATRSLAPSEEDAAELFDSGRFDEAIEAFEALFKETGNANYLFNIGRIYEEDGRLKEALSYYERFKMARGVELEMRTEASSRIKAIREILDTEGDAGTEPSRAEPTNEAEAPEGDPEPDVEASGSDAQEVDDERAGGPSRLAITGYVLAGVGGVALIAGGVVGGMAAADDSDLSGPIEDPAALRDRARRRAWTADGLFIGGGVLAATGVALIIVDVVRRKKGPSASARRQNLRVTGGPGLVGFGLTGRM